MRWVKEIFPPRPRCRWLLMTIRLSISSFAGTARTLVAVGTVRLAAMFWAGRAAAPRSLLSSASLGGGAAGEACAGAAAAGLAPAAVVSGAAVVGGAAVHSGAAGAGRAPVTKSVEGTGL